MCDIFKFCFLELSGNKKIFFDPWLFESVDAKLADMKGQLYTFFSDTVAEEHIRNSIRSPILNSIQSLPGLPEVLLELRLDLVAKTTDIKLTLKILWGGGNFLSHFLETSQQLVYVVSHFCQHKKWHATAWMLKRILVKI